MKISEFLNEMYAEKVDKNAIEIINKLQSAGFEANVVGGAVRDLAMGVDPNDVDITTNATPDEVDKLFPGKTHDVGKNKKFGITVVHLGNEDYEIATYREDMYSDKSDGRRPDEVKFGDRKTDSERRDFTINSLYLNTTNDEIVDYHNGLEDIKNKIIRFVGDPIKRIEEDKLRVLRAIRFSIRFGFSIDPKSFEAIKQYSNKVNPENGVSQERITEELLKMLKLGKPRKMIELLDETGLLKEILPELEDLKKVRHDSKYHYGEDGLEHTIDVVERLVNNGEKDIVVILAGLFHDLGKSSTMSTDKNDESVIHFYGHEKISGQIVEQLGKRMKLPTADIVRIKWLVEQHMLQNVKDMKMYKFKKIAGNKDWNALIRLSKADKGSDRKPLEAQAKTQQSFDDIEAKYRKGESEGGINPTPFINGKDLIDLGVKPGPQMGQILDSLYDKQLDYQFKSKEDALDYLRRKRIIK
jgi:poly(A) polymerase